MCRMASSHSRTGLSSTSSRPHARTSFAASRRRGPGNEIVIAPERVESPDPGIIEERGKIRGLRWIIIGMICTLTVINYVDRMTLSVLAPTIMEEFGMNNVAYSRVVTAFLIAYTLSQALSGRVLDRIGTRAGFMLFVGIWTVASMLHAIARSVVQLAAFRFLLGLGEAGNWPGAAKAAAERSEEHTSELQSLAYIVCRLL